MQINKINVNSLFLVIFPFLLLLSNISTAFSNQDSIDTKISNLISGLGVSQEQDAQIFVSLTPLVRTRINTNGMAPSKELDVGQWVGIVESIWSDEVDATGNIVSGGLSFFFKENSSVYKVYFADGPPPAQYSGRSIRVKGFRSNNNLLVLQILPD